MRIGILIKDFAHLANWELRIIKQIKDDPELELVILIKDGREGKEMPGRFFNKIVLSFFSKNTLGKIPMKLQILIEKKIFKEPRTVDKGNIINYLKSIPAINVKPQRKKFLDIFNDEDSKTIKECNLDIILRNEFEIIRGKILSAAKYGIWSFHHGDNSINRGGPTGFWEIMNKEQVVGVTLQQLTAQLDSGLVIDRAYFNLHWSLIKTRNLVYEASVSVLFKNIDKLKRAEYNTIKSTVYYKPLYRSPNVIFTFKYIFHFYICLLNKFFARLSSTLFGVRHECWTLFIGKGEFLNATLFRLIPEKLPRGEFWADPFLFNYKDISYVFFENYSYKTKRGKISCGKIVDYKIVDVVDVLVRDYHLSFPFIFAEEGAIYLMPETNENNRLEIYKCVDFPCQWEIYSTAFEGEMVADAVLHTDKDKQRWLFINKGIETSNTLQNELYIYKIESLKLKNLQPHKQNPVLIDSRTARNAGAIFEFENQLYRPSQRNIEGIYGRALNINKIEKLTINEYVESIEVIVHPHFHKGLMSMHHMHQLNGLFVIDAAYKRK